MMILLCQAISYLRALNSMAVIMAIPLIKFLFLLNNVFFQVLIFSPHCDFHMVGPLYKHADNFVDADLHPVNGHEI